MSRLGPWLARTLDRYAYPQGHKASKLQNTKKTEIEISLLKFKVRKVNKTYRNSSSINNLTKNQKHTFFPPSSLQNVFEFVLTLDGYLE